MERHRVRQAKAIDGRNNEPHTFIEVECDSFLEVISGFRPTHKAIHKYIENEKETRVFSIKFNERAFHIGLIKDWIELDPIIEEE